MFQGLDGPAEDYYDDVTNNNNNMYQLIYDMTRTYNFFSMLSSIVTH